MNSYQYRYILAIAEYKSFSRTADNLFVSQPYLSKLVTSQERELGVKLFDRSRKPLKLTPAGECYIEYIRELMHSEQKMKSRISEIAGHRIGKLTVGIPPTHGSYILPPILKKYNELYPEIKIVVEEQSNTILTEHILNGILDLCCFSLPEYPEGINYEIVKEERILLVLPPHHPLGVPWAKGNFSKPVAFPEESIKGLLSEKFVILTQAQGIGIFAREIFRRYGIFPDIFMETRNVETAFRLAAHGIGLTFIPEICTRFSSFEDEPYYFTIGTPPIHRSVVVAYKKGRELSNAEIDFIQLTREIV